MGFTYAWHINGEQWSRLATLATAGDCVYDVGANRGQSTLHLASSVGPDGCVVAFEPVAAVCQDLERNMRLNSLTQVVVVNAAAADSEGRAAFLFDTNHPTQGKLSSVEPTNTLSTATVRQVSLVRLDDYEQRGWRVPHLIKIDVEGGAASVLAGADGLLRAARPTVFIELHGPEERSAVRRLLDKYDYAASTVQDEPVSDLDSPSISVMVCRPRPKAATGSSSMVGSS